MSLLRTVLSLIAFGLFFIWAYFAAEALNNLWPQG